MPNSSSANSNTSRIGWKDEKDDQVRGCRVCLYRRYRGLIVAWHWALTFEWEDGYKATFDTWVENGNLTGRWKQGEVEEKSSDGEKYHWRFWNSYKANNCSPKQVNSSAKSLRLGNMKYDCLSTNCHEWAKALARLYGVELPSGIAAITRWMLGGSPPSCIFDAFSSDEDSMGEVGDSGYVSLARGYISKVLSNLITNN